MNKIVVLSFWAEKNFFVDVFWKKRKNGKKLNIAA